MSDPKTCLAHHHHQSLVVVSAPRNHPISYLHLYTNYHHYHHHINTNTKDVSFISISLSSLQQHLRTRTNEHFAALKVRLVEFLDRHCCITLDSTTASTTRQQNNTTTVRPSVSSSHSSSRLCAVHVQFDKGESARKELALSFSLVFDHINFLDRSNVTKHLLELFLRHTKR